jgi:hypothetical protein
LFQGKNHEKRMKYLRTSNPEITLHMKFLASQIVHKGKIFEFLVFEDKTNKIGSKVFGISNFKIKITAVLSSTKKEENLQKKNKR